MLRPISAINGLCLLVYGDASWAVSNQKCLGIVIQYSLVSICIRFWLCMHLGFVYGMASVQHDMESFLVLLPDVA